MNGDVAWPIRRSPFKNDNFELKTRYEIVSFVSILKWSSSEFVFILTHGDVDRVDLYNLIFSHA